MSRFLADGTMQIDIEVPAVAVALLGVDAIEGFARALASRCVRCGGTPRGCWDCCPELTL